MFRSATGPIADGAVRCDSRPILEVVAEGARSHDLERLRSRELRRGRDHEYVGAEPVAEHLSRDRLAIVGVDECDQIGYDRDRFAIESRDQVLVLEFDR